MRGARRLRPVRPTAIPSWDLSVVLEGLVTAPFEPLESASDRILTLKVVLLLALTSLKRVGDLQAFSVSETCMDFAPGLVKLPCGLGRVTFPRSCPRRSVLKWSLFTLSIPLPLLQVRMKDSTCSARSGHWSCMWIAPKFGENLPSYWSVLVLVAAGLNRPYVVGSFLGQIGSLSAWRVWYIVPKAASYAVLSYLWKRTSRVTRVTLVLWIGNEISLPSFSRCRQDSFRQKNLRSGWRVRQYDLTTSLRQRRRRAISQWIGVILYGFKTRSRGGVPKAANYAVSRSLFREQGLRE